MRRPRSGKSETQRTFSEGVTATQRLVDGQDES